MNIERKKLRQAEGKRLFDISLLDSASVEDMINELWWLPRDIVSDGYDTALKALSSQVPMNIYEYPTGMECFTWIIPEKWTCYEGYLETLDGRRIFSYDENPLHVVSYSLPFEGEVSRAELFDHLHVHPRLAHAIPFAFKYYDREWGLCCSKETKNSLTDDTYKVVINTRFTDGTLKVGEVVIPGKSDECIVLCTHLCHPRMVNDGLSGVVVGIDVMRKLICRGDLRYTYRLLIIPETIGSAAYLSHNEALVPMMKGGLFLEMLGTCHPHALQRSYDSDTEMDRCSELIVCEHDKTAWCDTFSNIVMNDERMFNAPGIRVPMLSLSKVTSKSHPDYPYKEYHSSMDTPASINFEKLQDSRDLVLKIIDALEHNRIPVPKFKGEVFWARFKGIDYADMFHMVQSIPYHIDGKNTVVEICRKTGVEFSNALNFIKILAKENLIEWTDPTYPSFVTNNS